MMPIRVASFRFAKKIHDSIPPAFFSSNILPQVFLPTRGLPRNHFAKILFLNALIFAAYLLVITTPTIIMPSVTP
jgi:hypothetical protein